MIHAEAHSDDRVYEINFDATAWFATASQEEIVSLARCGWGGDYPADAVAKSFAGWELRPLFDYLAGHPRTVSGAVGFECHVDESEARAWLKKNRPDVLDGHSGRSRFVVVVEWQLEEGEPLSGQEIVAQLDRQIDTALAENLSVSGYDLTPWVNYIDGGTA